MATKRTAKAAQKKAIKDETLAAERLVGILESQRQLGGESYPPTFGRFVELVARDAKAVVKALGGVKTRIALSHTGKLQAAGFVAFAEDIETVAASDRLLLAQLGAARKKSIAADAKALATGMDKSFAAAFIKSLDGRIKGARMPPGVGALPLKKPLFFLLSDAIGTAAPRATSGIAAHVRSFAERFDDAFTALDRASGNNNYVTLDALRGRLGDLSRADFDAGLSQLRRARKYSLDPSDGRHRQMTEAERVAGIMENGNLLVYVARRTDG
jgi:hypothetical protein